MQLMIAAVGNKMPAWITAGFDEYAKRMPPELRILLKEIKPVERSSSRNAATVMRLEYERIDAAIPKGARRIVLDEHGSDLTTVQLSQLLTQWHQGGQDVTFIIGGADGLDPLCKAQAETRIRLSSLTLPHAMVRVVLAEQLYRAWSVTQNHPYHRA